MLERLRVLGHVLRVEVADGVDQLLPVFGRVSDRQHLIGRVDLDRRDVELERRMRRLQVEARQPADRHQIRDHHELDLDPLAELALGQKNLSIADVQAGNRVRRVHVDVEIDAHLLLAVGNGSAFALSYLLVVLEVVRRPVERRVHHSQLDPDRIDVATGEIIRTGPRVGGVEGERAVRPEDVRRAHA